MKAASVLLARGTAPCEFFLVRRTGKLRFLGGFQAFPGGKLSPQDRDIAPLSSSTKPPSPERCIAAARELFEETGVLVARRGDGSFPAAGSVLSYLRRRVLADELTFPEVLRRLELTVYGEDFIGLGNLVTPPFIPTRFDTAFFLAQLPPGQEAEVWAGELDEGVWTTADAAVQQWIKGTNLVSPPTIALLQALVDLPFDDIPPRLAAFFGTHESSDIPPIFFAPDVQMIPLDTQSLPPSTHTNAYLVGHEQAYLLDPGTAHEEEQQRLFRLLDAHQSAGRLLTAIVLTHEHPDHIGAAAACAARYRLPIYAHPVTAKKLASKVRVDHLLREGDRLDLGTTPDDSGSWFLETLFTPGHSPGHLAFYDPHYSLLFVGDLVSTLSSVVIPPPPNGDLTLYLDSLRRMQSYPCRLLLPAHGSPTTRPGEVLEECIMHRLKREEQLLAALTAQPRSIGELTEELYKGLSPGMMRFAEAQILAGLTKLQREGRVEAMRTTDGEVWSRCKR
jgi:glyoxylase-like metal-dependent hydrolase (beta-lactamase superfamily II)/8-oxo-dGTP pyrophosphatase MutT (NUDIX family)